MTNKQDVFDVIQYPFLFLMGFIGGKTCDILNGGLTIKGKQYIKPLFKVFKLHPFCGILIIGIVTRYIPWGIVDNLVSKANSVIIDIAYVTLIYRGGFGLNLPELKRKFPSVLRMVLIPDIVDACIVFIMATFMLNMPTYVALSLGILAIPSSTGVAIPIALDLKNANRATDRDAPTVLISSCAFENIIGNTLFWIFFGFIYTSSAVLFNGKKDPYVTLGQTLLEIVIAFFAGLTFVAILYFLLRKLHPIIIFLITYCTEMLLHLLLKEYCSFRLFGIIFVFTTNSLLKLKMPAATSAECLKISGYCFEVGKFLFYAVIGAQLPLHQMNPADIGMIIGMMFIEITTKISIVSLVSPWSVFECKERIVFGILLASKGAAQVTLASQILFFEKKKSVTDPDMIRYGNQSMTFGVFLLLFGLPFTSSMGLTLGLRWVKPAKDAESGAPPVTGGTDFQRIPVTESPQLENQTPENPTPEDANGAAKMSQKPSLEKGIDDPYSEPPIDSKVADTKISDFKDPKDKNSAEVRVELTGKVQV